METSRAVVGLSFAMMVAFFFHWFILLPRVVKIIKETLSTKDMVGFALFSSEVKKILKPFFLGVLGVGAIQINGALDAIFARYASLEGPAYLWYAIRIEQVPVGLFGVALSAALLPLLSRTAALDDMAKYKEFLIYSMKKTFSLIFPCCVALFVLGCAGINFIYGRGDFSQDATRQTVLCLWGYGLGLLPSIGVMLLAPAFYARKSFRIPSLASFVSVVINVLLNYFFVFHLHMGALSVAIATSIAGFINFFMLAYVLRKKIGSFLSEALFCSGNMKTAVASLAAGLLTMTVGYYLVGDQTLSIAARDEVVFSRALMTQFLELFILGGFFLLGFISYAWLVDAQDILRTLRIKKNEE
jgi:putative peptidoglycan lipid II flippase